MSIEVYEIALNRISNKTRYRENYCHHCLILFDLYNKTDVIGFKCKYSLGYIETDFIQCTNNVFAVAGR